MQRRLQWWGFFLAFTAMPYLGACGDGASTGNENANGNDAAVTQDASLLDDGSTAVDNDQDGYPADQDCDDNDPGVYPGVRRDCQSGCDVGTEICLANGTWHTCTARTDCDCDNPGATRLVDCGNCGQAESECGLDLKWTLPGDCLNQGDCSPGEEETGPCPFCGTGTRVCESQCTWSPWEGCSGVCAPGTEQTSAQGCAEIWQHKLEQCNQSCEWEEAIGCTGDCLVPARTGTTDFADEICVPGGPFIMGCTPQQPGECFGNAQPQHTVTLHPFLMDKYEVTNGRYRACVSAGACTPPAAGSAYWATGNDSRAVDYVDHTQAVTFCQWDGGRLLPTEAQWEKGARGPAPRDVVHPWGDAPPSCQTAPTISDCAISSIPLEVDSLPGNESYYGFYHMGGNLSEWTADYYAYDYYQTSPSFEPTGPSTGTSYTMRGFSIWNHYSSWVTGSASIRAAFGPEHFYEMTGIRCARRGF